MSDKYVCQKEIIKGVVSSQKSCIGKQIPATAETVADDPILQLPQNCSQAAAKLCKLRLSCNLHDKHMRTGILQSSVAIHKFVFLISIHQETTFYSSLSTTSFFLRFSLVHNRMIANSKNSPLVPLHIFLSLLWMHRVHFFVN